MGQSAVLVIEFKGPKTIGQNLEMIPPTFHAQLLRGQIYAKIRTAWLNIFGHK
jgi:hypothetical protein